MYTLLLPKIVEKPSQDNLKVINNALPNKSGNPIKASKNTHTSLYNVGEDLLGMFCKLFYLQCCVSSDYCVAKILPAVWETVLYKNNCSYDSYKFSYKFVFILFSPLRRIEKQESSFQQVGGLVTRNITYFCFLLTHSFPKHSFCIPWKHQKTLRFSDVFRR